MSILRFLKRIQTKEIIIKTLEVFNMKRTTFIETIIFLYAVLFFYTGISKLTTYDTVKEQLLESPIMRPFASVIAITLPWIEFSIIILMIIPRWRLKGFYSALGIMTLFTIYIIGLLSFSEKLPCSCGGVIGKLSWPQHIILNLAFITMAIIGIYLQRLQKRDFGKNLSTIGQINKAASV
jgi:uncharacterized membrane protein YphA (DoxX/SURF4 family)